MNDEIKPRKVSADEIEVVGVTPPRKSFRSGITVMKTGPMALLFLPLILPIALIAFFMMAFFALFFGRGVFKVVSSGLRWR